MRLPTSLVVSLTLIAVAPSTGAQGLTTLWQRGKDEARPTFVAVSPDGRMVAVGTRDVSLRRSDDGRLIRTLPHRLRNNAGVLSLAFSPDGKLLATGDGYGTARLWRVDDGRCVRVFRNAGSTVAFSPDGTLLATRRKGAREVGLWSVADGKRLRGIPADPVPPGGTVAFSPDGAMLAVAERGITLRRLRDGAVLRTLGGEEAGAVNQIAFAQDGAILASGEGSTVRLWRVREGKPLHTLSARRGWLVWSVALSPDGGTLAASAMDPNVTDPGRGEIRFWRVRDGRLLQVYTPKGGVASVAFSPDGRRIVYGRGGGFVVAVRNPFGAPSPAASVRSSARSTRANQD